MCLKYTFLINKCLKLISLATKIIHVDGLGQGKALKEEERGENVKDHEKPDYDGPDLTEH